MSYPDWMYEKKYTCDICEKPLDITYAEMWDKLKSYANEPDNVLIIFPCPECEEEGRENGVFQR